MPAIPWYAYGIAALIAGAGFVLWFWQRLKAAERERLELAGSIAARQGDIEAAGIETKAETAADIARKKAGAGW